MDHAESTDDRGRIHLSEDVSERFRIVELPTHVALFSVDDDWLREPALDAVEEHDNLVTSILAFAGVLVLPYDRDDGGYDVDAPRAVADALELVPVVPEDHEAAVLAATAFVEEHGLAPFDVLHAGVVATGDGRVLSSERDYDAVGLERVPLEFDLGRFCCHHSGFAGKSRPV